jgi:hypothetical protein
MSSSSKLPVIILAFLSGFLIGFLTFYIFVDIDSPEPEKQDLFGMMGSFEPPAGFQKADEIRFDSGEIKAELNTQFDQNMVIAELEIESPEEVRLVLNYDKNYLRFFGKRFLENMNEAKIVLTENSLLVNSTGSNKLLIFFQNNTESSQRIQIQIYKGYNLVFENSVLTNK